ncbi:MAG: hypothetical protein QOG01_2092 [Pseudonocardiales bacterium]|nr:hypothetical protein [Pseudonocardiales bacterium]
MSTPAPSASIPSSAPASSSATKTVTVTATATTPVTPRSSCTELTIRVIRGSASPGAEFAALQFTNIGARSCTLVGYPTVTLLLKGKLIGTPSQPASAARSRMTLRPGDTAESKLNDYTSCQAPLSDNVDVVVPGSAISAVRPAQLRACILRVSPLGVPD